MGVIRSVRRGVIRSVRHGCVIAVARLFGLGLRSVHMLGTPIHSGFHPGAHILTALVLCVISSLHNSCAKVTDLKLWLLFLV